MEAHFVDPAKVELVEAISYLEQQSVGLGKELAEEIASALDRLKQFPEACPASAKGTRTCRTKRFPYGLVYQIRGYEIVIFAVMHLHRKPNYWKRRI